MRMVRLWRLVALFPLLAFSLFQVTSSSQDDQCRFTFTEDEVLDVTQSQDQGAKVSKDLHVSNKIQCAEECCSIEGEWCTLAVYHTQAMGDAINCFLVQCVPDGQTESVCVSTHMRHSGFILATVEHHIFNDHDSKTTTVATTDLKTTPTSKTTPTLKAVATTHGETDVSLPSEEEITTPTSELMSPSTPDLMKPNGTAENLQSVTNTIDVGRHDNVDRETVTKTGILIVALCFGIIFFLAMMVVIGKRWCEGYQRRKYSKVDYLINGIYS